MPTLSLPADPNFEQLRKQAKEVRDRAHAGDPETLALVAEHHPKGKRPLSLTGAQSVLARMYGFSSWRQLHDHVDAVSHYRRAPDEVAPTGDEVDEFLAFACLRYGADDDPSRWQRAADLLAASPWLVDRSLGVAAAAGDVAAVRWHLARDPWAVHDEQGPFGWPPLLYLTYARHDPEVSVWSTLETARALILAGADPDAGYLWHGLPTPFTALTGALGGGERDQPPHAHGLALAELLLDAGADANDGQALYNRQFGPDDRHLALLLKYGLGSSRRGPWGARMGPALASPAELVQGQLWWAVVHDLPDRVALLADHGVDVGAPFAPGGPGPSWAQSAGGRTPAVVAALAGCPAVLEVLVAHGADLAAAGGVDGLVMAVMAGDVEAVDRLRGFAAAARAERPGLMVWAAARRNHDAVRLLGELGFDPDALGRSDVPVDQPWESPLHVAAEHDDVVMVHDLLTMGADPDRRDARFGATPLGWARYFGRPGVVEELARHTTDP